MLRDVGRAKAVDRLGIIADDGDTFAVRLHAANDRGLQHIGILELVDKNVVELPADLASHLRILKQHIPIEQQIIVICDLVGLLQGHVGLEQPTEVLRLLPELRVMALDHDFYRQLRIDHLRIDFEAGRLRRKTQLRFSKPEVMPRDVHQIGRLIAVVNIQIGREPDPCAEAADQHESDRMKRAGPRDVDLGRALVVLEGLVEQALDARLHFTGGLLGECQHHNPVRVGAIEHLAGHPVRQRIRLAGAGASDDEQRAGNTRATEFLAVAALARFLRPQPEYRSGPLSRVELVEKFVLLDHGWSLAG